MSARMLGANRMVRNKSWREFERLVALIEQQLVPKGAEIKSPDRIRDKVTGRLREVDASIRFQIGSSPILITIECRERSNVQDDTWIEQLATKRKKIGAQQTIAVSSTGFSASAIATAKHYSLEVRQISEITDVTIASWIEGITITQLHFDDNVIAFRLFDLEGQCQQEVELDADTDIPEREAAVTSPAFYQKSDGVAVNVKSILYSFYRWQDEGKVGQESYEGLFGTEDEVTRQLTISFLPDQFYLKVGEATLPLGRIEIVLKTHIKRTPIPLTQIYQYASPSEQIMQVAVGTVRLGAQQEEVKIYVNPQINVD